MKSNFFAIIFLCLFGTQMNAQVNFGLKLGASVSNLITRCPSNMNCSQSSVMPGPSVGLTTSIAINENWGLQPELFYVMKGFNARFTFAHLVNYIALPILVSYDLSPKLKVLAGPEFSYEFNHLNSTGFDFFDVTSSYPKKGDFGVSFGFNYTISENWSFDFRYTEGLSLSNLNIQRFKYRSLYLSFHRALFR